jgi:hypothetical protein
LDRLAITADPRERDATMKQPGFVIRIEFEHQVDRFESALGTGVVEERTGEQQ